MMRRAVLIHMFPRPVSCHFDPAFERVGGQTILRRLAERLQSGLSSAAECFCVAISDQAPLAERIRAELVGLGFIVFSASTTSQLDVINDFCAKHPEITTLLLYPDTAGFPDMVIALDMIESHERQQSDLTIPLRAPEGLLPAIMSPPSLRRLGAGELPAECGGSIIRLFETANRLFPDDPECTFRINKYDVQLSAGVRLAELPCSAMIGDVFARQAAERTVANGSAALPLDSTHAKLFKKALIEVRESAEASYDEQPLPSRSSNIESILFCSSATCYSGAEASWAALIAGLDRRCFRPVALLPVPGTLSETLRDAGVVVEIAQWPFWQLTPFNVAFFRDALGRHAVKLVDINGWAGSPIVMNARLAKIPIVTHIRRYDATDDQDYLAFADRIVTVSNAIAEDIRRCDLRPERVISVYNGVDLGSFQKEHFDRIRARAHFDVPPEAPVITMVARVDPYKGYPLLFEALHELRGRFPGLRALLVGETFPSLVPYHDQLKKIVERLSLNDTVQWVGFLPEIAEVYAATDVLVVCNPEEPLARCVIEAMAMSVPVVATGSGGNTEIVEHEYNGLLYPPADHHSLAEALGALLVDESLRHRLGRGARATAERFSLKHHVDKMSDLFGELIEARRPQEVAAV